MNWLTEEQLRRNAACRDHWDSAQSHRQRMTDEITRGISPQAKRLCILGAGNCNDLDLATLTKTFAEVHLVDLDAETLQAAVTRQRVDASRAISLYGHLDITGVWDQLAQWTPDAPPDQSALEEFVNMAASSSVPPLPSPFDLVVSTCVLSQLIEGVVRAVGERHPRFFAALDAIRRRHLQLLTELTTSGGYGLLVTDFVSSDTLPELASWDEQELPKKLERSIESRNFFHGLNPFALNLLFKNDPLIAPRIAAWQLLRPWRWDLGPRQYAVTAIKFRVK